MACLFVGWSQLRIGARPRKTPSASLANYWKEGQGRFQFAANISRRRAEAARKGVAVFADRESRGYIPVIWFFQDSSAASNQRLCPFTYTFHHATPNLENLHP